jgi:hypothetical protein
VVSEFAHVLSGLDTVECAYYLACPDWCAIDFKRLLTLKEDMRQSKSRDGVALDLAGMPVLLMPYGNASGYPLVANHKDMVLSFGQWNRPSFFVKFRSEALWHTGAAELHQRFMDWALAAQLIKLRPETLSRVDFSFDYEYLGAPPRNDDFVSLAEKDVTHRKDGKNQTVTFGKGDVVLRVYNKVDEIVEKSEKTWFFDLWQRKENVWRVEWQVRKDVLRRFGIFSFAELEERMGDLLTYLSTEHDSWRVPNEDSNRSRWPLHPLWADIQDRAGKMNRLGVVREYDEAAQIDERLMRIAISVYGYLKKTGALVSVKESLEGMGFKEGLSHLIRLLHQVHDPLTWKTDITKRINEIRFGRW